MPASIRTTLRSSPGGPVVGPVLTDRSRDDLRRGYQVELESVHDANTYSWAIAFKPESAGPASAVSDNFAGTPSTAGLLPPEGSTSKTARFNVDWDGAYLIRLVVDAGLPTEDTMFLRLRSLTRFADIKLVAAGERRDENGVVPVDATPEGWSNDQNQNLLRILALLRRVSISGRVLYVDPNRGRDNAADQSDPDNIIRIPGPDPLSRDETGIRVRAEGFADFSSINDAISYASQAASRGEPAPSKDDPYWIIVRPGYYEENVVFKPFIHLLGEPGGDARSDGIADLSPVIIRTTSAPDAHHSYDVPSSDDELILKGIKLENNNATSEPVFKQVGGLVILAGTSIVQRGSGVSQGPAVKLTGSVAGPSMYLLGSSVVGSANLTNPAAYVMELDAESAFLYSRSSWVIGPAGIKDNNKASIVWADSTKIELSAPNALAYKGFPSRFDLVSSTIGNSGNPGSGFGKTLLDFSGTVGSVTYTSDVSLADSVIHGDIRLEAGTTTGQCNIQLGTVWYGELIFPSAPTHVPDNFDAMSHSASSRYVNDYVNPETQAAAVPPVSRLPVQKVQDAIDLLVKTLYPTGVPPGYVLDDGYDGLASLVPYVRGAGLGRRITADKGAFQIEGATYPLDLEDDGLLRGGQQTEGVQDIGPFVGDGKGSEISQSPNAFGGGPFISWGRDVFPDDFAAQHRGVPAAIVVAGNPRTADSPTSGTVPYNMQLRTRNNIGSPTGELGRIVVDAGTAIQPSSGASPAAGSVFIQGGSNLESGGGGDGGIIWIAPGRKEGSLNSTRVRIVNPDAATNASLVAKNAFGASQPAAAGKFWVATPNGVEAFEVAAGDGLADVINTINDNSYGLVASNAGGKLKLECVIHGPNGDVLYVGDNQSGNLNAKLGELRVNSGAIFIPGTFPEYVDVSCPDHGTLQIHGIVKVSEVCASGTGYHHVNPGEDYTIQDCVEIVGVDPAGGSIGGGGALVRLPSGASRGQKVSIKDESGQAGVDPIVIMPPAGQRIDGGSFGAPFLVTVNWMAATLYFDGNVDWYII